MGAKNKLNLALNCIDDLKIDMKRNLDLTEKWISISEAPKEKEVLTEIEALLTFYLRKIDKFEKCITKSERPEVNTKITKGL